MKYFVILIPFFLLFSCKQKNNTNNNLEIISIDLTASEFSKNAAAFKDYSFVKLETKQECLLNEITKVVCHKNRIYITTIVEPTVFIFDDSGKFLSKIPIGQGPGEVIFVSDLEIYDEKLYVINNYKTLKEYDLDGKYIADKYKFDMNYFSLKMFKSGIFLTDPNINPDSKYNIYFLSNSNEQKTYLAKAEWAKDMRILALDFIKHGYLSWPLSQTIYKVDTLTSEISPVYWVDFKGRGIEDMDFDGKFNNYNVRDDDKYAWWIQDFVSLKDDAYFSFLYINVYYVRMMNGELNIYNKLLDHIPVSHSSVGHIDNTLIFVCNSYHLYEEMEIMESLPDESVSEIFNEEFDDMDNPFLIFINLEQEQ